MNSLGWAERHGNRAGVADSLARREGGGAGPGSGPGTKLQQTAARQDRLGWCEGAKARESTGNRTHKPVRGQLGLAQGGKMTRTGQRPGPGQPGPAHKARVGRGPAGPGPGQGQAWNKARARPGPGPGPGPGPRARARPRARTRIRGRVRARARAREGQTRKAGAGPETRASATALPAPTKRPLGPGSALGDPGSPGAFPGGLHCRSQEGARTACSLGYCNIIP